MYEFLDRHSVFCINSAGSQEENTRRHFLQRQETRLIDGQQTQTPWKLTTLVTLPIESRYAFAVKVSRNRFSFCEMFTVKVWFAVVGYDKGRDYGLSGLRVGK